MHRWFVGTVTVLFILACGGGSGIEGTWWCNEERVNPECFYFDGGTVTNTLKGDSDATGTFVVEDGSIVVDWGKKRDVYRITNHSKSILEWHNVKSGRDTLYIAKDGAIR